jgi:hypothetical protein
MAVETFENDLCPLVRQLLGDTDVSGGDLFTNAEILPLFISAWDELIGMMTQDQIPAAKRTAYHILLANTNVLFPSQAKIIDLDSVESLDERTAIPSVNISAIAAAGASIQVTTSAPHLASAGIPLQVMDVSDIPTANGQWYPDIVDATNVVLRGSIFPVGLTYVSGGSLQVANTDRFKEVHRREQLPQRNPDTQLLEYSWEDDAFQFVGATLDVQLRIRYLSDGKAPVTVAAPTGSLVYDGIKTPLAYRTAALLAYKHGRGQDDGIRLDKDARGEALDGHDGHYYRFLQKKIRELQKDRLQRPVEPPAHLTEIYYPTY